MAKRSAAIEIYIQSFSHGYLIVIKVQKTNKNGFDSTKPTGKSPLNSFLSHHNQGHSLQQICLELKIRDNQF